MIRNFLSTPNVIGKLMIALLFIGGVVFAGAFDGFVVETQASSCCGGGMDDAIFSSSECCDNPCGENVCGVTDCGCARQGDCVGPVSCADDCVNDCYNCDDKKLKTCKSKGSQDVLCEGFRTCNER